MKTLLRIIVNIILISVIGFILYKYELAKDDLVITWMIFFYGFGVIAPFVMNPKERMKINPKKRFIRNVIPMGVVLLTLVLFWVKTKEQLISKELYIIITCCCALFSVYSWIKLKKSKAEIKTKVLDD